MNKKKQGFTLVEHKELGNALKRIHNELSRTMVEISEKYAISSKSIRKIEQAISKLQEARLDLDDKLFEEHKNDSENKIHDIKNIYL